MEKGFTPLVNMNEFDSKLTLAMEGDKAAIKFIDSYTIDRADGMGFDMFSKTSFWNTTFNRSDSICACVGTIYAKYKRFRAQQGIVY
jgi:hypothetical protein